MGRERGISGQRRLIAGLRITRQDEALLDLVRLLFPEVDSEGELAYRLWRRGLELTLVELAGLGVPMPPALSEEILATLVTQRLLLCLPLLRRKGKLAVLGLDVAIPGIPSVPRMATPISDDIDDGAAETIAGLGGNDFI